MFNVQFVKKELQEFVKTPKLIIVLSIFAFFAILSPLTAKYMNELLSAVASDVQISFPDPTFRDAWIQIYKNTTSLCLIVFLIMMTGTVAQEKVKGSILLVLTKRVSRFQFLFGKFIAGAIIWTASWGVTLLIGMFYTQILFQEVIYEGWLLSVVLIWLMGLFYISFAIFASVIAKTPTVAALIGFTGYAFLNLLNISETMTKFNPSGAISLVNGILSGTISLSTGIICLISTIVGMVLLFLWSFLIFRRQEI
ncbi:MAG: ABC transporter permease [Candidatus Izemoplasmatales bacterium]